MGVIGRVVVATTGSAPTGAGARRGQEKSSARPAGAGMGSPLTSTRDGLLMRMSDEDWDTVLDTNLGGTFYTCRAAARGMMKKRAGSIVNLTSVVGIHGNAGQTNYAASKAGIIGFTKSLAKEMASRGVRANAVAPGYI